MMKVTVLAEISLYFILSSGSFCSSNVYKCESGGCCTLLFFLTFILSENLLEEDLRGRSCPRSLDNMKEDFRNFQTRKQTIN